MAAAQPKMSANAGKATRAVDTWQHVEPDEHAERSITGVERLNQKVSSGGNRLELKAHGDPRKRENGEDEPALVHVSVQSPPHLSRDGDRPGSVRARRNDLPQHRDGYVRILMVTVGNVDLREQTGSSRR
jgi:hypothetical protein